MDTYAAVVTSRGPRAACCCVTLQVVVWLSWRSSTSNRFLAAWLALKNGMTLEAR